MSIWQRGNERQPLPFPVQRVSWLVGWLKRGEIKGARGKEIEKGEKGWLVCRETEVAEGWEGRNGLELEART